MAKRKYKVKGTNDFIVLAAIFFFLCLWAIKDAWFPSEKVLKKHPREVVMAFEVDGTIEKVFVDVGDRVAEKAVVAKMRSDRVSVEYEKAKDVYSEAKKKQAMLQVSLKNMNEGGASAAGIKEIQQELTDITLTVDQAHAEVLDLKEKIDSSELRATTKGKVLEVNVDTHTMVKAEPSVLVIEPADHFYVFNQSLAIFSFLAFWIFLAIHILAR